MAVPLRRDSEFGLTQAQFAQMPDRLRKKASGLASSDDPDEQAEATRLKADAGIWEKAAAQLKAEDTTGKWSIVWAKVSESDDGDDDDEEIDPTGGDPLSEAMAAIAEYGARNSKGDLGMIQSIHDASMKLGAMCGGEAEEVVEAFVELSDEPAYDMAFRESVWGDHEVTFAEADAQFDRDSQEVWITPIRPGPGNARDGYYYPPKMLKEAVESGLFDNVKMYANHPTKTKERELPERDVNDWIGVIKETVWDDSRQRPRSRLRVLDRGVFDKFEAAPEHIAFSVLGGGQARPGRVDGLGDRKIVESMTKVRSVDWVTEAGAGGGIDFAESADEEFDMDLKSLTIEQLKEGNPTLYAAIREDDEQEPEPEPEPTPEPEPVVAKGGSADTATPTPEGFVPKADYDALLSRVDRMEAKEAAAEARSEAESVIKERLTASTLPRPLREFVEVRFAEAAVGTGSGMSHRTADELAEAIDSEIEMLSKAVAPRGSRVQGAGGDAEHAPGIRESKEASIEARLGKEVLPSKDRNDGEEGTVAESDTGRAGKWASKV